MAEIWLNQVQYDKICTVIMGMHQKLGWSEMVIWRHHHECPHFGSQNEQIQ